MQQNTNVFDFLKEALRAEFITPTGRMNLVFSVLAAAIVIIAITGDFFEFIVNGILALLNKQAVEVIPSWFLPLFSVFTVFMFLLCLWVVRDMEIKKDNINKGE